MKWVVVLYDRTGHIWCEDIATWDPGITFAITIAACWFSFWHRGPRILAQVLVGDDKTRRNWFSTRIWARGTLRGWLLFSPILSALITNSQCADGDDKVSLKKAVTRRRRFAIIEYSGPFVSTPLRNPPSIVKLGYSLLLTFLILTTISTFFLTLQEFF